MCLCWRNKSAVGWNILTVRPGSPSGPGSPCKKTMRNVTLRMQLHFGSDCFFLCTHITPRFSSWASWSRFTLGPCLALLEGNKSHSFPLSEIETSNFIRGATYWLSWSSFKSRFTLLTTVTSGATRSTLTLVSSVTLRIIGENFITWPCQAETISSVNALILSYRFSSWSRIAKASSSTVSLSSDKTKSQNKELQL